MMGAADIVALVAVCAIVAVILSRYLMGLE